MSGDPVVGADADGSTEAVLSRRELRALALAAAAAAPKAEVATTRRRAAELAKEAALVSAADLVNDEWLIKDEAFAEEPEPAPEVDAIVESLISAEPVIVAGSARRGHRAARPQADPPTAPSIPEPSASERESVDQFLEAARLFGTSAEPIVGEEAIVEASMSAHVAIGRRRNRHSVRRIATTGVTLGVIFTVGALGVALALPSGTLDVTPGAAAATTQKIDDKDIQAFIAPAEVQSPAMVRADGYQIESMAQIAASEGIKYSEAVFQNDITADIQWPFKVGVGMSYGYGMRDGRMHEGIDFTPGAGAPNQAIADGVVRIATESGGGYGVTVYIDHVIDGEMITSHYSHMQYGSLHVKAGDVVKVGDVIGLTGNTGFSFGEHLHFELLKNGQTFDPLPWLQANAGRHFAKEAKDAAATETASEPQTGQ